MKLISSKIVLASTLVFMSFSALALKEDTNQPINIVSDNQSLDMNNRVVTFTDNVVITQGSIIVKASKVVITRPEENSKQKDKVEAFGNPVTFHQVMDDGKPVDGKANKVVYDLGTEFLTLTDDVAKQQLKANANSGARVKTVLIPTQLNRANGK